MVNSKRCVAALPGLLVWGLGSIPAFGSEPEVFKVQAWVVGTFTSAPVKVTMRSCCVWPKR